MKYVIHPVKEYLCDDCGVPLGNIYGYPYCSCGDNNYCLNCGLKRGLITAMEWLQDNGIDIYDHATYENGVITAYQKWGRGFRKDVEEI